MCLDEGSPEEPDWVIVIFGNEELGTSLCEFILAEKTIIVGVNGGEGSRGHGRVHTENPEEVSILISRDEAVIVGINGLEEQWQRTLKGVL